MSSAVPLNWKLSHWLQKISSGFKQGNMMVCLGKPQEAWAFAAQENKWHMGQQLLLVEYSSALPLPGINSISTISSSIINIKPSVHRAFSPAALPHPRPTPSYDWSPGSLFSLWQNPMLLVLLRNHDQGPPESLTVNDSKAKKWIW